MADQTPDARDRASHGVQPPVWARRIVLLLVLVALGYLAYLIAAEFFPRWWAEQIAGLVGGSTATGVLWGLILGAAFTAVPLLVLPFVVRARWAVRLAVLAAAVLLATPNWLNLSVGVGGNESARDGRALLAQEGPGFLTGSWIGVSRKRRRTRPRTISAGRHRADLRRFEVSSRLATVDRRR